MHIYDTLKAENWSELDKLTDYVNKKIAEFEKAIKAEAERFGQPEYADEDFCYNCWKDCISKNMAFGASIALSFYARMFGIRLLKDMIGQPCYTERDKEICDYYQDKEHMKFHEFNEYRFRNNLVWENITEIENDFDIPKHHKEIDSTTYGTSFLAAKSYFYTLCAMGSMTYCNVFIKRRKFNWTVKPWDQVVSHFLGDDKHRIRRKTHHYAPTAKMIESRKRYLADKVIIWTKDGRHIRVREDLTIKIPQTFGQYHYKRILKSEATTEELAMAIKE